MNIKDNQTFRGKGLPLTSLVVMFIDFIWTFLFSKPDDHSDPGYATVNNARIYTVSQKTSPMFLAITRESILGFS